MKLIVRGLSLGVISALLLISVSPALGQDGGGTHVVQPGENLYRIALQYGITVDALMAANGLTDASIVRLGQPLVIPGGADTGAPVAVHVEPGAAEPSQTGIARGAPRTHQVAAGENLLAIARRYGITLDVLMAANNLTDAEIVPVGQVLTIPAVENTTLPDFAVASPDLGLIGINELTIPPSARDPLTPPDMGIIAPGEHTAVPENVTENVPERALVADPVAMPDETMPDETAPLDVLENKLPAAEESSADELASDAASSDAASSDETPSNEATDDESASVESPDASESSEAASDAGEPSSDLGIIGGAGLSVEDMGILPAYVPEWLFTERIISAGGENVREIYLRGQELGNDPYAFSKIGDCNSEPPFFLAKFDQGLYDLGPFSYLQGAITHFAGSFERESATVWTGNHAWAVFDATWANPAQCLPGETPIECEFRVQKPSVVLIRLGTNEVGSPQLFEANLRQMVDFAIEHGTIPILGTKADQLEGSDQMNDMIRALAAEYELPLWDFGRAAELIAGRGLGPDGFHLSYYPPEYGDGSAYAFGHSVQNLTALMALNAVWRDVMY